MKKLIKSDIYGSVNSAQMHCSRLKKSAFMAESKKKKGCVRDRAPGPFYEMLGQTHVNGWSRIVASQNGGSTSYIFPLRLGVLQWSRHLFNYLDK